MAVRLHRARRQLNRQVSGIAIRRGDIVKGAFAGALGGLAGAWVMPKFQSLWTKVSQKIAPPKPATQRQLAGVGAEIRGGRLSGVEPEAEQEGAAQESQAQEEPTVKVARFLAERVVRRRLSEDQAKAAGPVVHYAYGALVGALYGALAETTPVISLGGGTLYGAAVWAGGDVVTLPLLGLAPPPHKTPLKTHGFMIALHAVYGLTLEGVRRSTKRILDF